MASTHAEVEPGPAKDLGEARDELGQKAKECSALIAKEGKLEKELGTLRDVSKGG